MFIPIDPLVRDKFYIFFSDEHLQTIQVDNDCPLMSMMDFMMMIVDLQM